MGEKTEEITIMMRACLAMVLMVSGSACSAAKTPGADAAGNGSGGGGPFSNASAGSSGSLGTVGTGGSGAVGGSGAAVPIGDQCAAISQTAVNKLQSDIIIAVDTSGSMSEEIGFVQDNLNAFSQQITASGIDARVILLAAGGSSATTADAGTCMAPDWNCAGGGGGGRSQRGVCIAAPLGSGMCPADTSLPTYVHVDQTIGSNDVLDIFVSAYPQYKQYLRDGATKAFFTVTDDDATDAPYNSAQSFVSAVQGLEPANPRLWAKWSYSSVYCFTACPDAAAVGAVHMQLVAQTGGVAGDLCLQDFKPVFDKLAMQVTATANLACEWAIPPVPAGKTFDVNQVNVQYTTASTATAQQVFRVASATACSTTGGWYYDDVTQPTRVLVCPQTCATLQADAGVKVDVLFGCKTVYSPS